MGDDKLTLDNGSAGSTRSFGDDVPQSVEEQDSNQSNESIEEPEGKKKQVSVGSVAGSKKREKILTKGPSQDTRSRRNRPSAWLLR